MESQYIYLIVALVVLAIVALAVIIRYGKAKISVKAPGVGLEAEGEVGPEGERPAAPAAEKPGGERVKDVGVYIGPEAKVGDVLVEKAAGGDIIEGDER